MQRLTVDVDYQDVITPFYFEMGGYKDEVEAFSALCAAIRTRFREYRVDTTIYGARFDEQAAFDRLQDFYWSRMTRPAMTDIEELITFLTEHNPSHAVLEGIVGKCRWRATVNAVGGILQLCERDRFNDWRTDVQVTVDLCSLRRMGIVAEVIRRVVSLFDGL